MEELVNKVAASGIITLDLEVSYPQGPRTCFDLQPLLWQGIALREADLRAFADTHDWSHYAGHFVGVHCSPDAIIPTWAFMLISTRLQPHAAFVTQGDAEQLERALATRFIERMDVEPYRGARVVVKGCAKLPVPLNAYVELTAKLLPVVKSLMFGEPCSTVPLYKAARGPQVPAPGMMRLPIAITAALILARAAGQVPAPSDSSLMPHSENGWYLSPRGTIRILVIFAEIDYDKNPKNDPQPEPTAQWPKGALPTWKDNLFDPFPTDRPKGEVTRYYRDISLGRFTVLGDYIDHVVTIHESGQSNMRDLSGMAWEEANKDGVLHTAHNLSIPDFDMWKDGGKAGLPKVNLPDEPHSYDHVMVILRNSVLGHGQGSTDAGSSGLLFGYPSDTQSRFGAMYGLPFEILKHEFNHLLLGGNNFHSGGGNAPMFDSYLLCDQGGWSMMGAANSSLLTCSAWDRDRLGWKAADAPFRINAHGDDGRYINGDLNPLAGDTGVYILKDFVTSGDALRLRMPFLPENTYQQWLWVENHQTMAHNGSPTDRFHWESTGATCLSNAVPGLYMTMQVQRDDKVGKDIYGGSADYLHALTASGHYDVILTDDTIKPSCPFNGQSQAYRLDKHRENPLSGNSEQELVVYDRNKDGRVERGEHFVMGAGYRPDGKLVDDATFFGAARDAWSINGKRVLGAGTNPSSANILTLRCNGKQEFNKGLPPDNRTVYINGMRVDLVEQRANGDIAVRVSTGDTRLTTDVRWCADSIVVPPLHGKDGWSLTVAKGACLLVDRSSTPTRMARQGTVKGFDYFAPPTHLTVSSGTRMLVEAKGGLCLRNGSVLHLMPGSELQFGPSSTLDVDRSSQIVLHQGAKLVAKASLLKKLRRKGRLVEL